MRTAAALHLWENGGRSALLSQRLLFSPLTCPPPLCVRSPRRPWRGRASCRAALPSLAGRLHVQPRSVAPVASWRIQVAPWLFLRLQDQATHPHLLELGSPLDGCDACRRRQEFLLSLCDCDCRLNAEHGLVIAAFLRLRVRLDLCEGRCCGRVCSSTRRIFLLAHLGALHTRLALARLCGDLAVAIRGSNLSNGLVGSLQRYSVANAGVANV